MVTTFKWLAQEFNCKLLIELVENPLSQEGKVEDPKGGM